MGYNIRGIAKAYNGDYDGGMKDIDNSLSIDIIMVMHDLIKHLHMSYMKIWMKH